jgi:HTH-type transcriptional regulator/antitoxin HigA
MPAIAERPSEKYICHEAPKVITSEEQHAAYVSWLLELQRQKHLKAKDADTARLLVLVIKDYESKQFPVEAVSPKEVLAELMFANDLRQKDLAPIFGGESVVSLVLAGRRPLNKNHIEKLRQRSKIRFQRSRLNHRRLFHLENHVRSAEGSRNTAV